MYFPYSYEGRLGAAQVQGRQKGMAHGLSLGFLNFVNFGVYALGLWYGGKLIREDDYEVNEILTVRVPLLIVFF